MGGYREDGDRRPAPTTTTTNKEVENINAETLEYLGARVDRARRILDDIKKAKAFQSVVPYMENASVKLTASFKHPDEKDRRYQEFYLIQFIHWSSIDELKSALHEIIGKYIETLEKEFEEL